jgi:hypothetical protein
MTREPVVKCKDALERWVGQELTETLLGNWLEDGCGPEEIKQRTSKILEGVVGKKFAFV